jgi:hypothetical protein
LNGAADAPPTASRRFARSDRAIVVVDCYSAAGAGPLELDARLLTRDGRQLAVLPLPALDNGRLRFELPLGSLGLGTYVVKVHAKQADANAEQLLAFSIVR